MALRYRMAPAYPFNAGRELNVPDGPRHSVRPADLWDDVPGLLFEYSMLSHRHRGSAVQRAGLEEDR
jgi:hypothetical protein